MTHPYEPSWQHDMTAYGVDLADAHGVRCARVMVCDLSADERFERTAELSVDSEGIPHLTFAYAPNAVCLPGPAWLQSLKSQCHTDADWQWYDAVCQDWPPCATLAEAEALLTAQLARVRGQETTESEER